MALCCCGKTNGQVLNALPGTHDIRDNGNNIQFQVVPYDMPYYLTPIAHWDTATGSFVGDFLRHYQYVPIIKAGYHKASFKKVQAVSYENRGDELTRETSPTNVVAVIRKILDTAKAYETGKVAYNDDGYISRITRYRKNEKTKSVECDTSTYTYQQQNGSVKKLECSDNTYRESYYGYESIWCKGIKGKSVETSYRKANFEFNDKNLLLKMDNSYESFVNSCNNFDPDQHECRLTYDKFGRTTSIIDSSVHPLLHGLNFKVTFTFTDTPLHAILNDTAYGNKEYPVLMLPQISKWLLKKDDVTIHRNNVACKYYRKYDYKQQRHVIADTPTLAYDKTEEWGMDKHGRLWIETARPNVNYNSSVMLIHPFWLHEYGRRENFAYESIFEKRVIPEPDTATYSPNEEREVIQEGSCAVLIYQLPRRGAFHVDQNTTLSCATYGPEQGYKVISYSYGPSYDCWEPGVGPANPYNYLYDFIVTGPDGLVKYIYKNKFLIVLDYEK